MQPIFRSSPTDDLVDWNSSVSVRTSTKSFSDFDLIWCVDRPPPHLRTSLTSTRCKLKVTDLGEGHGPSKVSKIALFDVYLLCRFGVELKTHD